MRRRALLASLAAGTAGLAGCSTLGSDDDTPTARTTETTEPTDAGGPATRTTQSPTDTPEPATSRDEPPQPDGHASIVELETTPLTYAFAPTKPHIADRARVALWFDRTATADHPARLRGWLENGNEFENTFRIDDIPVVGRTDGQQPHQYTYEASLHAAPTENNRLAEAVPEVARNDDGFWIAEDLGDWMPATHRMDADERVELEYALVGHPEMAERPTGQYEFGGPDGSVSVTVWETDRPGPKSTSRFAGRSVPAFGPEVTVQWYHDADRTTPAYVEPSTERIELDGRIEFEMVNNSSEITGCGHWNLHKLVDGEWFYVAPRIHTADCRRMPPGTRKEWTLRAFHGEAIPCDSETGCSGGLSQGFLSGGEYAVVAGYGHPANRSAALLELVGDPVELAPTDDAVVEQDGDTVTVTTDRYGDDEHPPDATFELTRADEADERLIAEQVMNVGGFSGDDRGLRNALSAMAADVDRVVVRTDEHSVDSAIGHDETTRRFRFRDQAYEATRDDTSE